MITFCCETCGKVFQSKACLSQHIANSHSKVDMKCSHCDFVATARNQLTHHLYIKHQKTFSNKDRPLYSCKECEFVTVAASYLREHVKTKHLLEREKCDHCDKTFSAKQFLIRHLRNIHSIGDKAPEFRCSEDGCNYVSKTKSQLAAHDMKVHQGVKFSCDDCSYSSSYKGDLSRHMKKVHQKGQFKCKLCDFSTLKQNFLTGHMIKYHNTDTDIN